VPLVDQAGEFDQLSAVGLLDEDDLTDVVPAGRWLRGGLDRDQGGAVLVALQLRLAD
jgi:hypothetical protein